MPTISRAERLAADIERRIDRERLAAGSPVGTIDAIQGASGYSRPTVNEAIRLLRDRGILRVRPGRGGGLFVAERGPVVRLRHTLLTVAEDPGTVAEAIELREHLELLIDLGAARHRSEVDIAELRTLLGAMADAADWPAFLTANWALHERIAAICPNTMARAVYVATLGHLTGATASRPGGELSAGTGAPDRYRAERLAVHTDLVEAIASGEGSLVRTAVTRHHTESGVNPAESGVNPIESAETPGVAR